MSQSLSVPHPFFHNEARPPTPASPNSSEEFGRNLDAASKRIITCIPVASQEFPCLSYHRKRSGLVG